MKIVTFVDEGPTRAGCTGPGSPYEAFPITRQWTLVCQTTEKSKPFPV